MIKCRVAVFNIGYNTSEYPHVADISALPEYVTGLINNDFYEMECFGLKDFVHVF